MALITCDFFSDALEMGTTMTVVLPQVTEAQIGVSGSGDPERTGFPVLYLLHGLSDDHSAWTRYTSIERYAAARGLAVVMPAVHRSFYTDEAHGHRYWTFVSEELPRVVDSFFNVSTRREDTFVAGLSMGGYGALKLALSHPERFAAAASLSGVVDINWLSGRPERAALVDRVFGGDPGAEHDVRPLLRAVPPAELPRLHLSCGTDEPLLVPNAAFVADAEEAGADVTSLFVPGEHEWGLWDTVIQDVIAWLPLDGDTLVGG